MTKKKLKKVIKQFIANHTDMFKSKFSFRLMNREMHSVDDG